MFSYGLAKNIHQYTYAKGSTGIITAQLTTATASTSNGGFIDRWYLALNEYSTSTGVDISAHQNALAQSCKVIVPVAVTLQVGEIATVSANLQDATSSTGAGVADYGSSTQTLVIGATGTTAAQTIVGLLSWGVDLGMADRYLRTQVSVAITTTQTTAGSSVQAVMPVILFGPGQTLVAST